MALRAVIVVVQDVRFAPTIAEDATRRGTHQCEPSRAAFVLNNNRHHLRLTGTFSSRRPRAGELSQDIRGCTGFSRQGYDFAQNILRRIIIGCGDRPWLMVTWLGDAGDGTRPSIHAAKSWLHWPARSHLCAGRSVCSRRKS